MTRSNRILRLAANHSTDLVNWQQSDLVNGGFDFVNGLSNVALAWVADGASMVAKGYANNDPIDDGWPDEKVGSAVTQGVADNRPVYETAGLNGSACVKFDGSNDSLAVTGLSYTRPAWHVVAFALTTAGGGVGKIITGAGDSGSNGSWGERSTDVWYHRDTVNRSGAGTPDTNPHLAVFRLGDTGSTNDTLWIDGSAQGDNDDGDATLDRMVMGSNPGDTLNAPVRIGGVWVLHEGNDPTAQPEWAEFYAAVNDKWGSDWS